MIKNILYIALAGLLILPIHAQVTEKIQKMHDECRLVRGHAYTIQQMIDQDDYNESVTRAHYQMIDRNLKQFEFTLREIETLLTSQQKVRVTTEIDRLFEICNDTKPMVESIREQLDEEETNVQRIRVLAVRINRNLRTAMEIQDTMLKKL